MREPDRTQLPLVETFGAELERAIVNRGPSRRRSQRRLLATACAAGLVAVSLLTAPGRAASGAVSEWLGLAEPGDPPTVEAPRARGHLQQEPISSIVLAAGRAPDGARYEFVLESFEFVPENFSESVTSNPTAKGVWHCLNLEWPDARVGASPGWAIQPQFGCHPTFPPAAVDEAVVRIGGLMFDPILTTHVQIAGFARSDVSDVRILYKNEHGAKRDAPVDFASVTGEVRARAGADGPFGVFIGFLPQAWLGYGANYDPRTCPLKERPYDPDAVELIAYDRDGEVITTETGNNGLSTAGRPRCP
ncbi:MAG: hypothetical protein ACRDN8_24640 [Thermoleophilaceae bacterium]